MSTRLLDVGDIKWEEWILDFCGIDYFEYKINYQLLDVSILEPKLEKIVEKIEELKENIGKPEISGKGLFNDVVYTDGIHSLDQVDIGYQILGLLILETGSFMLNKIKKEILNSTTWENDKKWNWSPDYIIGRKNFLKNFRRIIRNYVPEKRINLEKIPNLSWLTQEINGLKTFQRYFKITGFRKLLRALSLKKLHLDSCGLTEFPNEIFLCQNLEVLSLCNNKLIDIPEKIKNLTKLRIILLKNNKISAIPNYLYNVKIII